MSKLNHYPKLDHLLSHLITPDYHHRSGAIVVDKLDVEIRSWVVASDLQII